MYDLTLDLNSSLLLNTNNDTAQASMCINTEFDHLMQVLPGTTFFISLLLLAKKNRVDSVFRDWTTLVRILGGGYRQ